MLQCRSLDYRQLIRAHGSPLFLFFPGILRSNIERFREALLRCYPKHVLAYSVKTNYLPFAVRTALDSGVVPEIVSGLELDLVEKLGWIDSNTIVNGPLKTEAELRRILRYRCRLNVDNLSELKLLEELGKESGERIEIGLRVSAALGTVPWLRFGFRAEQGEVQEVARVIRREMPHLKVVGLHLHGGTNITDLAYYSAGSELLCGLARQLSAAGLMALEYLDLGGGFATDCPFKDKTEWTVPSAADYTSAITAPILRAFGAEPPTLIVEPGRYLIDDSFVLLTTVERIRGMHQDEVVMDAGINIFPSARFRRHRFLHLNGADRPRKKYSLFGPLCMQSDCLGERVTLPQLRAGDVLCVDYGGAYSLSQSWTFIRFKPAVVGVDSGSTFTILERENINHFLQRDVIHGTTQGNG
jgi:diaminopimelate decarboxylase